MSSSLRLAPISPITLTGDYVCLRPLTRADAAALWAAHRPGLTDLFPFPLTGPENTVDWVEKALAAQEAGTALPWVTVDRASGAMIGSTRFGNISSLDRRLEIGWTFIADSFQGGPHNSEAKLLQMTHAFETLGALRVELKTDGLNLQSQAAIRAIGAVQEGILRAHTATHTGRQRDTIYFSVLADEWPRVRAQLQQRVAARAMRQSQPTAGQS